MQPQRLLVPLFQRPYVWNEELQWEPLWKDLERVADLDGFLSGVRAGMQTPEGAGGKPSRKVSKGIQKASAKAA